MLDLTTARHDLEALSRRLSAVCPVSRVSRASSGLEGLSRSQPVSAGLERSRAVSSGLERPEPSTGSAETYRLLRSRVEPAGSSFETRDDQGSGLYSEATQLGRGTQGDDATGSLLCSLASECCTGRRG